MALHDVLRERFVGRAQELLAVRLDPSQPPELVGPYVDEGRGTGLMILAGTAALQVVRGERREGRGVDSGGTCSIRGVNVLPSRLMPEALRDWAVAAGRSSRFAPQFFTSSEGTDPRSLRKAELKHVVEVLELLLAAAEIDSLRGTSPPAFGPAFLPCLTPAPGEVIPFSVERERILPVAEAEWAARVASIPSLPLRSSPWQLGWIRHEDGEDLGAAWHSAYVYEADPRGPAESVFLDVDPGRQLVDFLHGLMLAKSRGELVGRPAAVHCSDPELFELVRGELTEADVKVELVGELPELDGKLARMREGLARGAE